MGLNEKTAREALRLLSTGKTQAAVARKFHINKRTISALALGRTWRHLQKRSRPRDRAEALFQQLTPALSEWVAIALAAVRLVAKLTEEFTTDEVWAEIDAPPADPRAIGAVMTLAQKDGVCEPTHRFRTSKRKICKGRPLRVWRSLVL